MIRTKSPHKKIWFNTTWEVSYAFRFIHNQPPMYFKHAQRNTLPPELKNQNVKLNVDGELIIDNISSPFHEMTVVDYLRVIKAFKYDYCYTVVYFLYRGKKLLYIGVTDDIISRLQAHHSKQFTKVAIVFGDHNTERYYQKLHQPRLNRTIGNNYNMMNPQYQEI